MESLHIEATENSPKITMDYENGIIEVEGKSYPENTFDFYAPILSWLETYCQNESAKQTIIKMKLTYFNSATSQVLFDFFDHVVEGELENLEVQWYYEKDKKGSLRDYEDYADEFSDLNFEAVEF